MKTRELVLAGILLALGLTLHAVTPALFGSVKPDFLLATMFIAILFQPKLNNTLVIGVVAGIMAALTTGFPGGQLPSVFDKIISALFVLLLIKLMNYSMNTLKISLIGFLGTLISGFIFLGSAYLMVGLPAPFTSLFMIVVLPTAIANTVLTVILYQAAQLVMKSVKTKKVSLT
jgi:hypothetical protein